MTRKRLPIRFNELEARGRGAVVRTREEIEAEEQMLARQVSGNPENQNSDNPDLQTSGFMVSGRVGGSIDRSLYEKVTYRISPDAVEAIDEIKRGMRRQHGIKVTREGPQS